ncbi:hypothetical protein FOZ60_009627 [Perkinsus olseni]|uniref:Uncharacterized protein n=1 Tax=Perkinsus olseni TaxID=32597 RepID=A0A7J6PCH4_PEROL|nr:hypothetical protein FOZ60_009627 [Perkinsus olseni]
MKLVDNIASVFNVCTAEKLSCRRSKSANGAVLEREGPYEGGNFGILVHIPLDRPKPGWEARWHQAAALTTRPKCHMTIIACHYARVRAWALKNAGQQSIEQFPQSKEISFHLLLLPACHALPWILAFALAGQAAIGLLASPSVITHDSETQVIKNL